jgi:hypothetical protein
MCHSKQAIPAPGTRGLQLSILSFCCNCFFTKAIGEALETLEVHHIAACVKWDVGRWCVFVCKQRLCGAQTAVLCCMHVSGNLYIGQTGWKMLCILRARGYINTTLIMFMNMLIKVVKAMCCSNYHNISRV